MKLSYRSSKLTYKSLFGYSLVVIALLAVTASVLANTAPGGRFFNFSFYSKDGAASQMARPLRKGLTTNHLKPAEENWYVYSRRSFNEPDLSWLSPAVRVEREAVVGTEGTGPPEAIPLAIGLTRGKLEAGAEIWYKFYYNDKTGEEGSEHNFIFYLTNTPLDDIRARHSDFAIYPGNQLHVWTRGTIDELEPLGTSSPALYPELKDERSLQVLWTGHLREDHVYYVKVYNHDIGPLAYELEIIKRNE